MLTEMSEMEPHVQLWSRWASIQLTWRHKRLAQENIFSAVAWRLISWTSRPVFKSLTPKKPSRSALLALCARNPPVTCGFPARRGSDAESVSMSWRHHTKRCHHNGTSSEERAPRNLSLCPNGDELVPMHDDADSLFATAGTRLTSNYLIILHVIDITLWCAVTQ